VCGRLQLWDLSTYFTTTITNITFIATTTSISVSSQFLYRKRTRAGFRVLTEKIKIWLMYHGVFSDDDNQDEDCDDDVNFQAT
jgi:hypothetical protein